ncbi:putative immunity protein [Rhodococcus triatomae]
MPGEDDGITLTDQDLRAVTAYAADCADAVLAIFEADSPDDPRPRDAIEAAREFADGGRRGKRLRDTAWAAMRAAKDVGPAAHHAAMAAMAAAGAAYLHPLATATQVKHVLGSAAHAALATELASDGAPDVGPAHLALAARRAPPDVVDVLLRYPDAPSGGGRVGHLIRVLDADLRSRAQ